MSWWLDVTAGWTDGQFWVATVLLPLVLGGLAAAYVPGWVRGARDRRDRRRVTLWLAERQQYRARRWQ